jgi:hypothetical protein
LVQTGETATLQTKTASRKENITNRREFVK